MAAPAMMENSRAIGKRRGERDHRPALGIQRELMAEASLLGLYWGGTFDCAQWAEGGIHE
jgi:hypothetical protein